MRHDDANKPSFFEAIAEGDEMNCRRMWLSVILQQYLDATGKFGDGPVQARARAWLEGREGIKSGLYEVCFYAGIDFEKTRQRFEELSKNSEVIDFRMVQRDKEQNQTPQNSRRYYRRKSKSDDRRRNQRKQAEEFLFGNAANDNFPEYSNDNFPESLDENSTHQPKENA